MQSTLTDDPRLYGLEMPLSNICMIGLLCSNIRMVFFFKTENSYHSKLLRDHTFMTSTWKGDGGMGGILKFVTRLQILLFSNERSTVHFCSRWRGWGTGPGEEGHKIGHFLWPS